MATSERPLSPHLQIYRPQLTSLLSIAHRGCGVVLALGTPLLVYWFWAVAAGTAEFGAAQAFFGSLFGRTLLLGWSYALCYHLCNGLRHLFWDIGGGYELTTVYRTGYAVLIGSGLLTFFLWAAGYLARGGV